MVIFFIRSKYGVKCMARRMKYDVEAKEETKDGEDGFLSRWSARKSKIAKGEDVPDEVTATEIAEDTFIEDEEDAALTDAELLKKYDLPDPEAVTEESVLEQFLNGKGLPGRVRQMALRRLWRLNPLFGVVDDMVEYGEDYTDAATVIEGMQTAYTVGKGYAKEVVEPEEADALDEETEAKEGDSETKEGEVDGQQDENERGDDSVDQLDQAKASETAETSDTDNLLVQNNDGETVLIQGELPKMLGESQVVLSKLVKNTANIDDAVPASFEKGTADIKALQAPVGGNAQMKETINSEEKTEQNHIPAWRPARMDFRKK